MNVKKVKKKLSLKRLTVAVLNYIQVSVLKKDEQKNAKGGNEDTVVGVGVTSHPIYC